jgi:hypothetical protein
MAAEVHHGRQVDIPPPRPSAPPTDTMMEDIPSSSMQPAPRSSHPMVSHSTDHPNPNTYMHDILQHLQGISLR